MCRPGWRSDRQTAERRARVEVEIEIEIEVEIEAVPPPAVTAGEPSLMKNSTSISGSSGISVGERTMGILFSRFSRPGGLTDDRRGHGRVESTRLTAAKATRSASVLS
jgi:hypothetical protein